MTDKMNLLVRHIYDLFQDLYAVSKRLAYALLYIGVGRCLHYFVRTGRELVSVWEGSLSLHAIMLLMVVINFM